VPGWWQNCTKDTGVCFLLSGTGRLAYPLRRAAFRFVGTCSGGFAFMSRMFFFGWMNKLVKVAGCRQQFSLDIPAPDWRRRIFRRNLPTIPLEALNRSDSVRSGTQSGEYQVTLFV
jgi:hypothetical protein